ncbi:MAG: hypothetical protein JXP73_10645 [Deltaproteobacteria bacterium]|jgi:hypothetical protein|nr:hypothetical protein [Deltaproteobacteria bacterium]
MKEEQPEPSRDPYRAPGAQESVPGADSRPGSFAQSVSIALAIFGIVIFWGVLAVHVLAPWGYRPSEAMQALCPYLAVAAHLTGLGVVWIAPRGRRAVAVLANALPLLVMFGLFVLAYSRMYALPHLP